MARQNSSSTAEESGGQACSRSLTGHREAQPGCLDGEARRVKPRDGVAEGDQEGGGASGNLGLEQLRSIPDQELKSTFSGSPDS